MQRLVSRGGDVEAIDAALAALAWVFDFLFYLSARLFGTAAGMARDPVQVGLAVLVAMVAFSSLSKWWILLAALACSAFIAAQSFPKYSAIGLDPMSYVPEHFVLRLLVLLLLGFSLRALLFWCARIFGTTEQRM